MPVTVGSPLVSPFDLVIVAGVALAAGVINSIAGGGSLILFPTLVALGLGTVPANVTNSVAQWPGYLGGIAGFRSEYTRRPRCPRSEEHTSELQSHSDLVCRLLLEKKKKHLKTRRFTTITIDSYSLH